LSEDHGTVTVEQPPAPDETDSPVTSSTTTRRAARFQRHQRVVLASVLAGGALVITGGVVAANVGLGADGSSAAAAAIVEPVDRDGAAARSVAERLSLDEDGAQTTYTVEVDGETFTFTSSQDTLAAALADAGIQVGPDDEVSAPLNGPVTDVVITRVNADTVTEEEIDAHETIEQETDELYEGETRVQTEGVDGRVVNTYRVTSAGGEETGRELVASVAVDERVDEVVLVGTREREPVQAAPAQEETESTPAPSTEEPAVAEEPETTETAPTYTGGDPRGIAQSMMQSQYGWGADQFSCLNTLWNNESGWNPSASNPSSGAYGIPQALPGSKMAAAGADWRTNPATQISWGLGYISDRYGTPCGALSAQNAQGWY
jgi:hypothetical protein